MEEKMKTETRESLYDYCKKETVKAFNYPNSTYVSDGDIITYLKKNASFINVKEMSFSEAIRLVKDGEKVRMLDWDKKIAFIKMIKTKEKQNFNGELLVNQPFIAVFYRNGSLMPHPYIPSSYDIIAGRFSIVK